MTATARLVRRLVVAAGAAALAAGCATPTPYQPIGTQGARGGFSEVRVAPNRYRVTFTGNTLTSRQRVENYLLFRAAELTLEQGSDCFTIVDRATDRNVETRVYRDPFVPGPYAWWRPSWRYRGAWGWRSWDPWYGDPFWADNIDVRTVQSFEANAEIAMTRSCRDDDPRSFPAREVIANLQSTIELPRDGG
jgi:hypothetical protein